MSTDLTGILSALVVVVLAAFGVVVGRRGARNRSGAGSRVAVPTAVDSPGSDGGTATIEVDPRTVRTLRLAYAPQRDGQPDAGEVVCEGRIVHRGASIATSEGRLLDGRGKLLAHGTETCLIFPATRGR